MLLKKIWHLFFFLCSGASIPVLLKAWWYSRSGNLKVLYCVDVATLLLLILGGGIPGPSYPGISISSWHQNTFSLGSYTFIGATHIGLLISTGVVRRMIVNERWRAE